MSDELAPRVEATRVTAQGIVDIDAPLYAASERFAYRFIHYNRQPIYPHIHVDNTVFLNQRQGFKEAFFRFRYAEKSRIVFAHCESPVVF
jgi:hypothetical protein